MPSVSQVDTAYFDLRSEVARSLTTQTTLRLRFEWKYVPRHCVFSEGRLVSIMINERILLHKKIRERPVGKNIQSPRYHHEPGKHKTRGKYDGSSSETSVAINLKLGSINEHVQHRIHFY